MKHFLLKILYWVVVSPYKFFFKKPRSDVYGKAQWMGLLERKILLSANNQGLYFSSRHRLSLEESFKNLLLVSPTGGGKTTRYVIPNILNAKGSIVVTDPSSEIYTLTSGHMRDRGYNIQVLQPADLSKSLRFNPLSLFKTPQELKQLATILGTLNAGADLFWITGATNIIYICLSALSKTRDKKIITLGNVRNLLNMLSLNDESVDKFMAQNLDTRTFNEYKAFLAQDPKVAASILSSARASLDLWSDPGIVDFTDTNDIDIAKLRNRDSIVYIIVPENHLRYFAGIINIFYSACFEFCIKCTCGNPVFFFLDEFGNLPKIPNFSSIATTLRKKRCSISIILQELSQLASIYGKEEAQAIYAGGMSNKAFFSGLDVETCRYLENLLGATTVYDYIKLNGSFDIDDSTARTVAKPLMHANEIRMLPKNQAILITGAHKPVKLNVKPFFLDSRLKKLTQKKPAPFV